MHRSSGYKLSHGQLRSLTSSSCSYVSKSLRESYVLLCLFRPSAVVCLISCRGSELR